MPSKFLATVQGYPRYIELPSKILNRNSYKNFNKRSYSAVPCHIGRYVGSYGLNGGPYVSYQYYTIIHEHSRSYPTYCSSKCLDKNHRKTGLNYSFLRKHFEKRQNCILGSMTASMATLQPNK